MESSSRMYGMSSGEGPGGFVRRKGQIKWRALIDENSSLSIYPGRMPTGYGKTESFIDGYEVLRSVNKATRLLVVVPTDTQETAYAEEFKRKAEMMGIDITGVIVAASAQRTLSYHLTNQAEVFVITVQRLQSSVVGRNSVGNWILDLLEKGKWVGAADEYHHYASDNEWGKAMKAVSTHISQWMALSATPDRRIGDTIFGPPIINVSYQDALDEGAVKRVAIKIREYGVNLTQDGLPLYRTTSQIRDEIGDEPIDEWEARKQLRYLPQYCSPILFEAISELDSLILVGTPGAKPQMLVYAFSCNHAEALDKILKAHAPGLKIDWVGTGPNGRPDADNEQIIKQFKDVYNLDGRIEKQHELDILVQVNKASEGFNAPPVCVIVDLSLSGFTPQKLQAYGRGTRTYFGLSLTIFIPTDSEIASLAHHRHRIFDLPIETKPPLSRCDCCVACPDCEHHEEPPWPLPDLHVLNAQLIGGEDFEPTKNEIFGVAEEMNRQRPIVYQLRPKTSVDDYEFVRKVLTEYHVRASSEMSEAAKLKYWIPKVTSAVRCLARNAMIIREKKVDPIKWKPICTLINGYWKKNHHGHDAMTASEFEEKYQWLSNIDKVVLNGNFPAWLKW